MTSYSSRPYTAADLRALTDFAVRCTAARAPKLTYWNVGDLAWQLGLLPLDTDFSGFVRLWEDSAGQVVGLAVYEPPLNFEFDVDPAFGTAEAVRAEIFGWIEERRRETPVSEADIPKAYAMLGADTLSTTALQSDSERIAFLESRGYQRVERHSVRYSRDLADAIPPPVLPRGMRLRHVDGRDIEARAELHRDAWSVWGNSSFSAGRYRRLRATHIYDETLDIVVEGLDWGLLSYCVAWLDSANGVGHFEPVGTRPAAAGKGLGRAVVLEGLRRLKERGAHTALIGTASVNDPALKTYTACGFEFVERQDFYSKELK